MGDIADTAQTVAIYWIFGIFSLHSRLFLCSRWLFCGGCCHWLFVPQSVPIFLRPIGVYLLCSLLRFSFSTNCVWYLSHIDFWINAPFLKEGAAKNWFTWRVFLTSLLLMMPNDSVWERCLRFSHPTQNTIRFSHTNLISYVIFFAFFSVGLFSRHIGVGWSITPGLESLYTCFPFLSSFASGLCNIGGIYRKCCGTYKNILAKTLSNLSATKSIQIK